MDCRAGQSHPRLSSSPATVCPTGGHLVSLGLSFLVCKMGMMTLLPSSRCRDYSIGKRVSSTWVRTCLRRNSTITLITNGEGVGETSQAVARSRSLSSFLSRTQSDALSSHSPAQITQPVPGSGVSNPTPHLTFRPPRDFLSLCRLLLDLRVSPDRLGLLVSVSDLLLRSGTNAPDGSGT